MLYSYLLTKSEFSIDPAPESVSRDVRYAYSAYIDLLLLLIELSGRSATNERQCPLAPDSVLASNKVGAALAVDDDIRSIILRGTSKIGMLDSVLPTLQAKIQSSAVYADYKRKTRKDLDDDVTFWITVIETIFAKDAALATALRADENFTNVGFEKAIEKLCNTLRSYNDSRQMLKKAQADLKSSLNKAYELYLWLFKLIIELTDEQAERIETAKNRYNATSADRNPNTRLIDNALVEYLRNNEQFNDLLKEYKLASTNAHPVLIRKLLDSILQSELYRKYVDESVSDMAGDVEFWREAMRTIILPSEALTEDMEDRSVYWNDDLQTMGTFVLKTLRQLAKANGAKVDFLPKFKDDEDERFGPELFMKAVVNTDEYRKYIDKFIDSSHWDIERMAFMDVVIMITAITELINYPKIPVPVTVNEYVEIANNYSTDRSGSFINGILFSVINHLKEQGIINK